MWEVWGECVTPTRPVWSQLTLISLLIPPLSFWSPRSSPDFFCWHMKIEHDSVSHTHTTQTHTHTRPRVHSALFYMCTQQYHIYTHRSARYIHEKAHKPNVVTRSKIDSTPSPPRPQQWVRYDHKRYSIWFASWVYTLFTSLLCCYLLVSPLKNSLLW